VKNNNRLVSIKQGVFGALFITLTTGAYAASCEQDVDEMRNQISQYQSITRGIYKLYSAPLGVVDLGTACQGNFTWYNSKTKIWVSFSSRWAKGNWGDTLSPGI